jgi:RNA polymerase sigma factor (sigma-70 family)
MTETPPNPFLHHIRHLIGNVPAAGMTDRQLLERFLADRDETAVEVLVRRYGPLVLGVCRRVLCNAHAAEDAFQATFLVLVRKAPSLVRCQQLGGYLYTVAYRLALRARANEARRRQREARAARNRPGSESHAPSPSDLVVALEEELQRLPERHRAPLVLCYLEGKTNEQAAEILGCPRGSMAARLVQARERLRQCLARRGFVAPSAGLATLLTSAGAEAAVPLPLLCNTERAAVWFAGAETGGGGFVSGQAVALARGACRAMVVHKLRIAGAVLLAAAMLGTGATMLLKAAPQDRPPAPAAEQPPPETRDERLPRGVLARMGTTRLRHGDAVFFAAYTPDGRALVTAGQDRTVRLWDLATGQEIRRFDWGTLQPERTADGIAQAWEHQTWDDLALSSQAALSADGKRVAASRGGLVCVWETATGKPLRQLHTGENRLDQLAFSADGKSLLTLGPWQATAIWDVATGKCVRRREGQSAGGFRVSEFAAVADQVAVVSRGWKYLAFRKQAENDGPWSIYIRELATGKDLAQIQTGDGRAPLTFSPDEKVLVWARFEGGIVFADAATGKELRRLGAGGAPYQLATNFAFSADGKMMAVSWASHTIEIWDLMSGKRTARVAQFARRGPNAVGALVRPALAFSPDGKRVVSSLGGAALRQFEADTGREVPGPADGHQAAVSTLALSADGRSLWTSGRGDPARRWDWATGQMTEQRAVPGGATPVVFASDGRFAFADGNKVALGGPDGTIPRRIGAGQQPLTAVALSPGGTFLATRSLDDTAVRLWDATTGKERHSLGAAGDGPTAGFDVVSEMTGVVTPDLVFSPDGRCLAGAGPRGQLCLWDVATANLLWELPPQAGQAIERLAFSANGLCLAAVTAERRVILYETVTGQARGPLGTADPGNRRMHLTFSYNGGSGVMGPRREAPICLAFSADGRYLATAQETPAIHVWDVLAGREVGQLRGHEGGVVSLLWAPDGRHLFSGGTDTTALTWDVARLTQAEPTPAARLTPAVLDALWNDLAGKDAARAFEAMRTLSASPGHAVPLIRERVRPAAPVDPTRLGRLLTDLQSDRFEARRQAEADAEGLGESARPALRRALADDPPPDLRQRLERLLDKVAGTAPPAGLVRDLRAVEMLEWTDTAEARQVLHTLAGGEPGARLTREARNALQRLARQAVRP